MSVTLTVDPTFSRTIAKWAAVAGKNLAEAFRIQGRLLAAELIKRTPPFSGKAIMRILSSRGYKASLETEAELQSMTARNIGRRRVEKDIRRVIYGMRTAPAAPAVHRGQSDQNSGQSSQLDWGTLQKCEGKQAVRIFATKKGMVYGVDLEQFKPNASNADLYAAHQRNRLKRGRVTTAGSKTRVTGRWKWIDALVTDEATVKKFIARKQSNVGRAKGGWARSFMDLGGRMSSSGWVGKHASATGRCEKTIQPYNVNIVLVNKSEWAQGGDDQRIIQSAMAGRQIRMVKDIERMLKESFK